VGPEAVMEPSSTYNWREQKFQDSAMHKRGKVYIAERMGERGEPSDSVRASPVKSLKDMTMVRSKRKDSSQSHSWEGNPNMQKRWTAQSRRIWSKKPCMSKRRVEMGEPEWTPCCTVWSRVSATSTAQYSFHEPNWFYGRRR